ncbi:MAG: PD40 domain-containing protein [Gemmatimonadota bacterium]|nr:MAG: PD40 domain-containing protein [Gemmatimonadota bacterium]
MRPPASILVLGVIALTGCDSRSQASSDGSHQIATAGLAAASRVSSDSRQDSSRLVARRVWFPAEDANFWGGPSPDGRYLSYTHFGKGNLAIYDLRTGEYRLLTRNASLPEENEFALNSTFAPDGKRIAYAWENLQGFHELRVTGVDGSAPQVLYSNPAFNTYPTEWSSDGESVLVCLESLREERPNGIGVIAIADGSLRLLKQLDRGGDNPTISPDGRFVAYSAPADENGSARDIFAIEVETGNERALVQHPADDRVLGWSPDRSSILFSSDRTGTVGAWLLPIEEGEPNGEPRLVKPDMWRMQPIGFARNGSYFYGTSTTLMDVYVGGFDPQTGELVGEPTLVSEQFQGSNMNPAWSPDGRYLAYVSMRGAAAGAVSPEVVVIRSTENGKVREIEPELRQIGNLRWSADGRYLLLRGRDEQSRRGLFRIDVQSGTITPCETGHFGEWSADGESLILYGGGAGQVRISRLSLENGSEEVLYRGGPYPNVMVEPTGMSPDYREIAFLDHDETGGQSIKIMPIAGGTARALARFDSGDPGPLWNLRWSFDEQYVFYVRRGDDDPELWRVPVAGGDPEKLDWFTNLNAAQVRFHPDGRRVALTRGQSGHEIWVMDGFLPSTEPGN